MPMKQTLAPLIVTYLIATALTNGCDDRAADVAREAADRQARQNETMAELQQEVAAGTKRLVEEEAKARQQSLDVHRDLQAERSQLGEGWNDLETQRQAIAGDRRTQSFLAVLATGGGAVVAGLLALAFAWLTMYGLSQRDDSAQDACELLIGDLVADQPRLTRYLVSRPGEEVERLPSPADGEPDDRPSLPAPDRR